MSRWGDEKTTHFICLYRGHECLWNIRSPLYKNKLARDNAYIQILEDMNDSKLTIKDIKNKIKGLRSTYHQELNKINRSKSSGDGTTDVYKPSLVWFNEMDFLQDTLEYKEIIKVRRSPSQAITEASEQLSLNMPECILLVNSDETAKTSKRSLQKRKRTEDEVLLTPQRLDNITNAVNPRSNEDEFYYFGLNVAAQLRTLPLSNALDMQSKIQMLLSTERRKLYQDQSSSTLFSETSVHCPEEI